MLKVGDHVVVYAPAPAVLLAVTVREGQTVALGAVVAELANPDLDHRRRQVEWRIAIVRHDLAAGGFALELRGRSQILARELETVLSAKRAIAQEQGRLTLTSPRSTESRSILRPPCTPDNGSGRGEPLLAIRRNHDAVVEAYVPEEDLRRLAPGVRPPSSFPITDWRPLRLR